MTGQIDGQPVTVQFTLERQVSPKRVVARRVSPGPRKRSPPRRSPVRRSPPPRRRSPRKSPAKTSPKATRNRSELVVGSWSINQLNKTMYIFISSSLDQ